MTIYDKIRNEKEDFEREHITIVDNFEFNQKDTIQQIYRYYHSKFKSGDIDKQGDKKYFFNIVRSPCNVATKAIDFDTKDIKVQTAPGGDPVATWYFERDLKFWFKDQGFGTVINRLFHELPIYGSVVLKIIKGKPYFVDLRNFIVDQSANSLDDAEYIIEEHNYNPHEFRRIGEERGWDNVEEAIKTYRQFGKQPNKDRMITVYERYGETDEKGHPYKRVITTEIGKGKDSKGFTLADDEMEHPYREFHWEKIPGRWLGVGRVEILFDPQIRINELSNQQVKSSYWSTLRLWQTRDDTVSRNLMTDVENGEVLPVDSEITQVDLTDRNLAQANTEINRWLVLREDNTFSSDVMIGKRPPAGATLGGVQLAAGMATSYFSQIQENVADGIKEMLYEDIIPKFEKESNKEHVLRIAGEDLDTLNKVVIKQKARQSLFDFIASNRGKLPSQQLYETKKSTIGEMVKSGKEKLVRIPAGFYKNLKYKIDIIITGEARDNRAVASNLFSVLQAITADPTLLQDPNKKKLFYRYLEKVGISPEDLDVEEAPDLQTLLASKAGGGVSRPTAEMGATKTETRI